MKTCPKCDTLFDSGKWNKSYCSRKCANSRIFSEESNRKRSKANSSAHAAMSAEKKAATVEKQKRSYRVTRPEHNCIDCGTKVSKHNKYKRCKSCFHKSYDSLNVVSHRCKTYERITVVDSLGNDHYLIGSYEIKYYNWLVSNNIRWKKPNSIFYKDNLEKTHWYKPDFHLIDSDQIVEIKGYFWNNDKIKMKWVTEQHSDLNILILTKAELTKMNVL